MSPRAQPAVIRCLAGEIDLADATAAASEDPIAAGLDAREQALVSAAIGPAAATAAVTDALQARRWGTAPLSSAARDGDATELPVHAPSTWDCAEVAAWLDAQEST